MFGLSLAAVSKVSSTRCMNGRSTAPIHAAYIRNGKYIAGMTTMAAPPSVLQCTGRAAVPKKRHGGSVRHGSCLPDARGAKTETLPCLNVGFHLRVFICAMVRQWAI